jgi:hypothetical protein
MDILPHQLTAFLGAIYHLQADQLYIYARAREVFEVGSSQDVG